MKPGTPNPTTIAAAASEKDETMVLRIAREPLRWEPPAVRFVPRDIRLPQL
jgi:hypothetical protein